MEDEERGVVLCKTSSGQEPMCSPLECSNIVYREAGHCQRLDDKKAPESPGLFVLNSLVDHEGEECIIWPYSKTWDGHGQTYYCGEVTEAHRVMCLLAHGEPPTPNQRPVHTCGADACINPAHLRWESEAVVS